MDMELNDYTTTSIIVPSIYERRASGEQRTLSTERSTIWKYVTTPLKPQLPDDNFLSEPCADELAGSNALLISARRKCTCRFLWNYELHGLTAYLRSRTVGERLLWIVIIFICMFFAVTTTHTMFSDYLEHQTATLITIKQKPRLMLPSLTICPKNPDALNYQKVIRDISKRLPRLDRVTLAQLLAFVIAGAGFNNVDAVLYQVLPNKIEKMNALFRRWKAKRSMVEFYTTLFEKHGYSCSEFFNNCYYGYHRIPCCDIFRPHYVMLRGRCFRIDNFYQSDPDALGRLTVFLNQLPSRITEKSGLQPQTVVYVSDKYPDVATFPRLYLDFHETRYIRVRSRRMVLLPWNNDCSESPDHVGRTCYVTKWLRLKVAKPLNCTVFYLRHKMPGYKVCEPVQVIRNYHIVTNTSMLNEDGRCLPACHRFDYVMKNFRAESTTPGKRTVPAFRLEISYMDLEVERYEEILTTRLPDFVSQLGGQSGLFVGMSACTVVQVLISVTRIALKFLYEIFVINHRVFN